jgi:hypothetical protein
MMMASIYMIPIRTPDSHDAPRSTAQDGKIRQMRGRGGGGGRRRKQSLVRLVQIRQRGGWDLGGIVPPASTPAPTVAAAFLLGSLRG